MGKGNAGRDACKGQDMKGAQERKYYGRNMKGVGRTMDRACAEHEKGRAGPHPVTVQGERQGQ